MTVTKGSTKPVAAKGKASNAKATKKAAPNKGDVAEIIRSYLYDMREEGITQVDEKEVLSATGYARTDSTGYRKVMKELTKELEHVVKSQGKLELTEVGVKHIEANGGPKIKVKPASNEEHQEQLKEKILKNAKAPKKALDAIWQVLVDGKPHEKEELLEAAGYQRADSTGYREIKKWLTKLNLLEKQGGAFVFTDNVYRFGSRPN